MLLNKGLCEVSKILSLIVLTRDKSQSKRTLEISFGILSPDIVGISLKSKKIEYQWLADNRNKHQILYQNLNLMFGIIIRLT